DPWLRLCRHFLNFHLSADATPSPRPRSMAAKEEARPLSFERAEGQTRGGRDESLMPEKPPRRNSLARRPCFLLARMHESSPISRGQLAFDRHKRFDTPSDIGLKSLALHP